MEPQAVFDKFLRQKDIDGAFNYVADKLAWDPESVHLRGMTAFSFRLREQYAMARFLAEEVLKDEPGEPPRLTSPSKNKSSNCWPRCAANCNFPCFSSLTT